MDAHLDNDVPRAMGGERDLLLLEDVYISGPVDRDGLDGLRKGHFDAGAGN